MYPKKNVSFVSQACSLCFMHFILFAKKLCGNNNNKFTEHRKLTRKIKSDSFAAALGPSRSCFWATVWNDKKGSNESSNAHKKYYDFFFLLILLHSFILCVAWPGPARPSSGYLFEWTLQCLFFFVFYTRNSSLYDYDKLFMEKRLSFSFSVYIFQCCRPSRWQCFYVTVIVIVLYLSLSLSISLTHLPFRNWWNVGDVQFMYLLIHHNIGVLSLPT